MPRKKTTKKISARKSSRTPRKVTLRKSPRKTSISTTSVTLPSAPVMPTTIYWEKMKQHKFLYGFVGIAIVLLLLLAFPLRFLVVPVIVNGQPIFSWQYVAELHKQAGEQILDQMIAQKLVEQEISSQNVQVTESEINNQIKELEDQIPTESGGLESVLALQGLTRNDLVKRIRFVLGRDKLVKGTITITDEEINKELAENAILYKDLSEVDAATTAAENLRLQKFNTASNQWFQSISKNAKIHNSFSSPALPLSGTSQ